MIQPTQHTSDKQQYLQECQSSYSNEDTTLNIYVDSSRINFVSTRSLSKKCSIADNKKRGLDHLQSVIIDMLSWHGPNSQQQTAMPQFYNYNRCPASSDIDLPKYVKTLSYLICFLFFLCSV